MIIVNSYTNNNNDDDDKLWKIQIHSHQKKAHTQRENEAYSGHLKRC